MALVTSAPTLWPIGGQYRGPNSLRGPSLMSFDSTTDRIAVVTQGWQDGSLSKFYFYVPTVTVGCTLEVRVETKGADGRPSGTLWGTNTNGTVAVSVAGTQSVTLTSPATILADDFIGVVIKYSSGAVPNMTFAYTNLNYVTPWGNFPGLYQDTGTGTYTWTNPGTLHGALEFSTVGPVWNPGFIPLTDASSSGATYNSGSTPDEIALRFQTPWPGRVRGGLISLDNIAVGADFKLFLWDSTGTTESGALAQLLVDGDITRDNTADGCYPFCLRPAPIILPNTPYYLGVRAQTANSLTAGHYTLMNFTNAIQAMPSGAQCYRSWRTWSAIDPGTVGAWTDDLTTIPSHSLFIDQLESGGARRALWY